MSEQAFSPAQSRQSIGRAQLALQMPLQNLQGEAAQDQAQRPPRIGLFRFKQRLGKPGLANHAHESAAPEGVVKWHEDSDRGPLGLQLHDPVTTALAHSDESVLFENLAKFGGREDPQPTQRAPQPA